MIGIKDAMLLILLVVFFLVALYFSKANTVTVQAFEKKVSEESLAAGLYYSTQALPCLSKNPDALDETKRFVLDRARLDAEAENYGVLSCARYGEIEYWVGVYDLDRKEGQWTFRNFLPLEDDKTRPSYGQIVLIDDGGKTHRAFIGAYIGMPVAKGKLPLWVFCNSTAASEPIDFTSILNVGSSTDKYEAGDVYSYSTNNCETGNCVKGPGQARPTCQPKWYDYSKDAGDSCELKYECKSISCTGGKCDSVGAPRKLAEGQPCRQDSECASNKCAYDKRCRATVDNGIDISPFKYG